jgi:hypothetical protein
MSEEGANTAGAFDALAEVKVALKTAGEHFDGIASASAGRAKSMAAAASEAARALPDTPELQADATAIRDQASDDVKRAADLAELNREVLTLLAADLERTFGALSDLGRR